MTDVENTNGSSGPGKQQRLTRREVTVGVIILFAAQMACASTATCVQALPAETPSVLRGLWRQTLTSAIFSVLSMGLVCWRKSNYGKSGERKKQLMWDEGERLLSNDSNDSRVDDAHQVEGNLPSVSAASQAAKLPLVAMAVCGAALQNDLIIIALQYASSAAVMCLCNTTPIWLILYTVVHCGIETPGIATIVGAAFSLVGAVICATVGGEEGAAASRFDLDTTSNGDTSRVLGEAVLPSKGSEGLGALIALMAAVGAAFYMTACRKLAPVGLHPVHLTLVINVGMTLVSLILCISTVEGGVTFFSRNTKNGFFGFLNPEANPAAFFHSLFPDCLGNFGIMLSLSLFEPLIVSMVMLTEPLNASFIAMNVVGEAPPSRQTILGVAIVLLGCAVVLWQCAKKGEEASEIERGEEARPVLDTERQASARKTRRVSQVIVMSPIGTLAPDATAKAAFRKPATVALRRSTLPLSLLRQLTLESSERDSSLLDRQESTSSEGSRRATLTSAIIRNLTNSRLSFLRRGSGAEASNEADPRRRSSKWNFFSRSSIQSYGSVDEGKESAAAIPKA